MTNIPYITIKKINGINNVEFVLLNDQQYHIDRVVELLSNSKGINFLYYEVIWQDKKHHSGLVNFKKHKNLHKMIELLYKGQLRGLYKNKKQDAKSL